MRHPAASVGFSGLMPAMASNQYIASLASSLHSAFRSHGMAPPARHRLGDGCTHYVRLPVLSKLKPCPRLLLVAAKAVIDSSIHGLTAANRAICNALPCIHVCMRTGTSGGGAQSI